MDDGYSPVSILVLIGFILLEAVFYGFGSAIQNVNEGKLEDEARQGNRKAARLLEIVNRPGRFRAHHSDHNPSDWYDYRRGHTSCAGQRADEAHPYL